MSDDPQELIDQAPMSAFQVRVVAIMIGLNALDGFDVLSISFASPGIAKAWGIDRAALGLVLSMELIGMAAGSLLLGRAADRIGRRSTILACLSVMAVGMLGASFASGVVILSAWRLLTGLGIGGMLAATNAAVSEVSSAARRKLCVVLMAAGYPVGTIVGGSISAVLLRTFDWPAIFHFGALATLCFVPIVFFGAPESITFLLHKRPPDALKRINDTLRKMRHPPISTLPPEALEHRSESVFALFAPERLRVTALLTIAYLAHIMTFYFILKWIPKIVVDMGFVPAAAAGVLVWASVGGLLGSVLLGLLTGRIGLLKLTIGAMLCSIVLVVAFGQGQHSLHNLSMIAAAAGFFTNAGVVGLYALTALAFPTSLRGTATGFIIGIGRGGSAMAPALAGLLFAGGLGVAQVAALMALGSLVGAIALIGLRGRVQA
ncbi:MFS transporter [Sphingomonas sp. MMS24-J45]|uniref:MFS transporter n=1 Tax=Sphingomonas sp. MMS24-J45 TaxID=3238806 RepID=UPI00384B65C1